MVESKIEERVKPLRVSSEQEEADQVLAACAVKHPDFIDYAPIMIEIANRHPSLGAEDIYQLAKARNPQARGEEEKKEMNEGRFISIDEIRKTGGSMLTDHEKKAIGEIIYDSEIHFLLGPQMFSSRVDFNAFLNTEVEFHAKYTDKIDFEKAKEAYMSWAKKYHSSEYDQLGREEM